jgi:RNA recognition motif-containing protein
MVKLFFGGFPLDMPELELAMIVARYATISTLKIVRDKKTRKCKGYAFFELTDREGAERAIEALDGTSLSGRIITLNVVEEKPVKTQPVDSSKKKRPRLQSDRSDRISK